MPPNQSISKNLFQNKSIEADTLLAAEFLEISFHLFSKNINDSAFYYVEKAAAIYEKYEVWEKYISAYNHLGKNLWEYGKYPIALTYHRKALELCMNQLDDKNPLVADTYLNLGISLYYAGDFDGAIENYQNSLSAYKAIGNHASKIARIQNNIGIIYKIKGNFDKALAYYHQSLTYWIDTEGELHPNVAAIYNNIGYVCLDKGDYDRALDYYNKALNIKLATLDSIHVDVAIGYNNLGAVYQVTGHNDKALEYYNKALSIRLQVLDEEHPDIAFNYNNLGIVYTEKGDFQEALAYHQRALSIWMKKLGENHPDVAKSFDHIGIAYAKMGEHDRALGYYNKALAIWDSRGEKYSVDLSITFQAMGEAYYQKQDFEMALQYYQKALMAIVPDFIAEDIHANPEPDNTISQIELLATLEQKAAIFQHLGTIKDLETATATYQLASDLITLLRTEYEAEGSKLFISEKASEIYNDAIAAALKLYELSGQENYKYEAFVFAEKNKANMLLEMLSNMKAKRFAGVPDSLLEKEQQIKTDIIFYNNEIQQAYQYAKNESDKIKEYQNKVFSLRTQYQTLKRNMEENFPGYYKLKYDTDDLDIIHFQRNALQENQILLEYFIGEQNIIAWLLDKGHIDYVKILKPDDFEADIQAYLSSLKNRDFNTYVSKGYTLYQTLLEPVLAKANNLQINHLLIIPDGILGYLPFETLVQANPAHAKGYKDLHYLINDYEISYHYSANLLAFEPPQQQYPQNTFIGFAPAFTDDTEQQLLAFNETVRSYIDSARALPYAEEEVRTIASLLEGNFEIGPTATEQNFKNAAADYQIIHLASHSLVDDTDPLYSKLIFDSENDNLEDGLLHTYELYNMQLNASLVTLSACNTGVGKYYKGEGIVSLARGFMYAGVPNVMMSLWSVADRPTRDIMQYFYEELDKGTPYASALHKAKLRYLEKADNLTADPYYWGAFIYLGQPVDHTGHKAEIIRWIAVFVLIVFLIGGAIFIKKKYSSYA